jgi:uncharacterized protein
VENEAWKSPLLIAVWPGMGQVAVTAGFYLMSRLHMDETEPLPSQDLFDVDQVDIKEGLVRTARIPKTRVFRWKNAATKRDIIVLIGEAQPPAGKLAFCHRLLDYAERIGVQEIYTFAAMADDVSLRAPARVFGVSTHPEGRDRLRRAGVTILSTGHITGLNGVLLGVAAQRGIHGLGLLGEMPALVTSIPYAKASSAVLEKFCRLTDISIELQELEEYGRTVENHLADAIDTLQKAVQQQQARESGEPDPAAEPDTLTEDDRRQIETLFTQAARQRSKTFELKRLLDRLGVFDLYEDRFLDLFRKPPPV